ncbi:MAG: hypothetical protein KJ066_19540 [Acidobacteria bacterium]|nr:hypothetical protein [Acidobacteriota bacterium]
MARTLLIAGADWTDELEAGRLSFEGALGAIGLMTLRLIDLTATKRPAVLNEVLWSDDSTPLWRGAIQSLEETNTGFDDGEKGGRGWILKAADLEEIPRREPVNTTYPEGQTLKQVVTDLATLLGGYDITVDTGMADGPTLPALSFAFISLAEAFEQLAVLSGWTFTIGPDRVLRGAIPGSAAFPHTITSDHVDLETVRRIDQRGAYQNLVHLLYGPEGEWRDQTEVFAGDGSTRNWTLAYVGGAMPGTVTILLNGDPDDLVIKPLGVYGDGTAWQYRASDHTLHQAETELVLGATDLVQITYSVPYPQHVVAADWDEVALVGRYGMPVESAPTITDRTTAAAYAVGLVRRRVKARSPRARLTVWSLGWARGQTGPIDIPERGLSGTWLIERVRTEYVGADAHPIRTTLEVVSSDEALGDWQTFWVARLAPGGGRAMSGGGVISGGSAGVASGRHYIDLGGSRLVSLGTDLPAQVPLSEGREVTLYEDDFPDGIARVVAAVATRHAATSVTPVLTYWTGSAWATAAGSGAPGVGSPSTSTTFGSPQTFLARVQHGKRHRLELLRSNTTHEAYGMGYIE